ncbi:MAG: PIN domain-containing protein [Candidatus Dormibacteraeota bacterium]|nr:PIN domain-containing protein [Candidatus Dormibacteraeota bacterium]MBO0762008.1 PIN domain-containing protein [Candidatus Dormibacteraeota bacterium]
MTGPLFVDTNVLVYARDPGQGEKHHRARTWMEHLWRSRAGRLSTQVLNEYYYTVTRKLPLPLDPGEARRDVQQLHAWQPLPVDVNVVRGAWQEEDRFSLNYWDALIVAAARLAGCVGILTEDLANGQDLDGLQVVSPFSATPAGG